MVLLVLPVVADTVVPRGAIAKAVAEPVEGLVGGLSHGHRPAGARVAQVAESGQQSTASQRADVSLRDVAGVLCSTPRGGAGGARGAPCTGAPGPRH